MTSSTTVPAATVADRLAVEYERLVELNRSRDSFLRTVSHELRTPLTSILSCTELLADTGGAGLSGDQREFLDIVGRSATRLLQLVEDLLELAGLEAGRLPLHRGLADLPDVVAEAVQGRRDALAAAGLELRLDLSTGPPVDVDAERVRRLVEGLLANAEQYTPAGGRVSVLARPTAAGWTVAVADTGIGVPAADRRTVFDAFARADNARDAGPGSGLGLAIGRTVAALHGGSLELTSTEGAGTTVTLRLPYAYGPASGARAETP